MVLSPIVDDSAENAIEFRRNLTGTLQSLRQSVAATLAGIGDFGKPADFHKTLRLDRTLSRQLHRLASNSEPLGHGGMIPPRTGIDRFLRAVKARGAPDQSILDIREAYRAFEEVVEFHVGDRATLNSMVSEDDGVDEDWLAADMQHRRNAFKAMSHALGMQSKSRTTTYIVRGRRNENMMDIILVSGLLGLRVFRESPRLRVYATTGESRNDITGTVCRPIGLSNGVGGYLIEQFSSGSLPVLSLRQGVTPNGLAREIFIEKPVVGNVGSSTLMFGSAFDRMPLQPTEPIRLHTSIHQPTEKQFLDVLIDPDLCPGLKPTGRLAIDLPLGNSSVLTKVDLEGDFQPDYLGLGPQALETLEIPAYRNMLDTIDAKEGWGLSKFEAWRIRLDVPIFMSTLSFEWHREGAERAV